MNAPLASPASVTRRQLAECSIQTDLECERPFADIALTAAFTAPDGTTFTHPGFYDGDGVWKVRFNPTITGEWRIETSSVPAIPELAHEGTFTVEVSSSAGFLRSTPDVGCGFSMEDGTPVIPLGDTVYNLFGFHHCGHDVRPFMERRLHQGFNFLRVRVPVSPFHPPHGYSDWQTKRTQIWTGSEQAPNFHEFNLEWFRTVDEVMFIAEELGMGIELIMEAWGFEFPWNHRTVFTPEWEELYLRYLIARYDAFTCLWWWTPMNEYEFYPNGDWNYTPDADRWLMRIARWIKATGAHNHPVAAHNGPRLPPFAERFRADPEAIDTIMFQEWGSVDAERGWLADGIEEITTRALKGWDGSAILAEWGYERNPAYALNVPGHEFCDRDHTRRGAWCGAFMKLGLAHGFEPTWGPWCDLDLDLPGVGDIQHLRNFLTDPIPWLEMDIAEHVLAEPSSDAPTAARALATPDGSTVAIYLPAGGEVSLHPTIEVGSASWFDPRTGQLTPAVSAQGAFSPPESGPVGRPFDWVLVAHQPHSTLAEQ